uniref:Uncharacterized protein n=1 Tax=viral metagenome TaxID=1070528 RepID=A0A6C0LAK7_9ZZZZ
MTRVITNAEAYIMNKIDYFSYLENEIVKNNQDIVLNNEDTSKARIKGVIDLGPRENDKDKEIYYTCLALYKVIGKSFKDNSGRKYTITPNFILQYGVYSNYGNGFYYDLGYMVKKYTNDGYILVKEHKSDIEDEFLIGHGYGGNRRYKATSKSKAKPKHDDMTMKDIKELCKANQIKLSRVVEGKCVVYNKKELITKLKRKKLL